MGPLRITALLLCFLSFQTPAGADGVKLSSKIEKASFWHAGLKRDFLYYVPADAKTRGPLSLVLLLHGGGGKPEGMVRTTFGRFNELADRDGFIAVYPAGIGKQWNDGRNVQQSRAHRENIDDVGFINALLNRFLALYPIDPKRVYVTGISNGAMMSNRLACEMSDRFAAAAPVAGSLPKALENTCKPVQPISMMVINGDFDPLVPYQGGWVNILGMTRGEIFPVRQAVLFWAKNAGCSLDVTEETLPERDPKDGTTALKLDYTNKKIGAEVILYTLRGGGHAWPMGWPYLGEKWIGIVSQELDASDVIWEFFKTHPKK